MNRLQQISQLTPAQRKWDMIVIGGGATGLGTAVDAASRGYAVLLLEQHDFAKGTSSRSTKLIHGGVRYLQQGNVGLVLEALKERGLLVKNAPHLVQNLSFIVPNYHWWSGPFYGIGLKIYDLLAGKMGLAPSRFLSAEETLERLPTLEKDNLYGGVIYYDGQFDDSRLAVNLAQTAIEQGAVVINYMQVTGLLKEHDLLIGVRAKDALSGEEFELRAEVVINATGVFTQSILNMDDPGMKNILYPSQGVHLVLDKKFLPGDSAIMVPHTDDGRVLFAVPWHGKVVVGTTDTPMENPTLEPRAMEEEVQFILKHAARYLQKDPERQDVKSVFAGLRPLVKGDGAQGTATLSRDHTILVSSSGLVTVTGGKWTTYRKMSQDTVDQAILVAGLEEKKSITTDLPIHGWMPKVDRSEPLYYLGADARKVRNLVQENPKWGERIHPELPYLKAEIVWAVREEMAMTLEDVLARRTRALFLDAYASQQAAIDTANIMATEMGKDVAWQRKQVEEYRQLAQGYLLSI